jgi:IS4 transposase
MPSRDMADAAYDMQRQRAEKTRSKAIHDHAMQRPVEVVSRDIHPLREALAEAESWADGEAVTAYCILRDAVAKMLGEDLGA